MKFIIEIKAVKNIFVMFVSMQETSVFIYDTVIYPILLGIRGRGVCGLWLGYTTKLDLQVYISGGGH